ncbi:DUF2947 family protein [Alteromonas oceanisediminis]|uniref:DUF2947 family protein n=1 Tax=Alteromonas oceanisediminis TaxID=2836180 RepID=UPI001BD9E716|nr:DUF2947 family protein [Alteromonas oceanisediminis]MBT0587739.1 DUF2947 domain-containing protein [Alteromonas oceanisediminis]
MENIDVKKTEFKSLFDSVPFGVVQFLGANDSKKFWKKNIDEHSNNYFRLPESNWIVSSKSIDIGRWLEPYNEDSNKELAQKLKKFINIEGDLVVHFAFKGQYVFAVRWADFLQYWDSFLAMEDDSPILLIDEEGKRKALVFNGMGNVILVNESNAFNLVR